MKKVIIIGGGGHALSLLEMIKDYSFIEGYTDLRPNNAMPVKYLGTDDEVIRYYSTDRYQVHHALVYTSEVNMKLRKRLLDLFSLYESATFISDSALVSKNSDIQTGVAIFEKAVLNRSKIGCNTIINTGAIIEHDCCIGNNVFIGPGVIVGGGVTVQDNSFIGMGTVIRDGVSVCSDVVIGMGSLVVKNINEPGMYVGSPVKLTYDKK